MGSGNPSATHWSMPFGSLSDVRISGFAVGKIAICQSAKQPRVAFPVLSYPTPRSFQRQLKNLTCCSPKPGLGDTQRWHEGSEGTMSKACTDPACPPEGTGIPEELSIARGCQEQPDWLLQVDSQHPKRRLLVNRSSSHATCPETSCQILGTGMDEIRSCCGKIEAILSF